jgi:YfiR/HmsC-like
VAVGFWVRDGATQSLEVPVRLQAELLSKAAAYDRGFAARARGRVLVFVVVKTNDPESARVGEQIMSELGVLEHIGGLPHSEELIRHTSPGALAELCKTRLPAIVYLSTNLGDQVEQIADALDGLSILSVAVSASYVPKRAIFGFDSESGKPKLLVNLGQARRQQVAFRAELLRLARVIQ